MISGWVDVVLSYAPAPRVGQVVQTVMSERLVLYSNRPDSQMPYDPGYVFVDYGEMYRRQHGEAYYDAGTAKISFDSLVRAREYLIERGGSAYFPSYMATADIAYWPPFCVVRGASFSP